MYSQYQKIKDFSLGYKLFTHKNYMTLLFTEGKVDIFLSPKLNDCINWKIFYCTRSTRRKEISLSTTHYSLFYGSLRFIERRGRTACMHPMWRVACCRTSFCFVFSFFFSDLIEAREEHFTGLSLRMFFRQISMSQCLSSHWRAIRVQQQIWNRTRPRALVQNQQTGELIICELLIVQLWWSLCTLYLHACQVRVTVGDSGLCCCTCVKPVLNWAFAEHTSDSSTNYDLFLNWTFISPNMVRAVRRTLIRSQLACNETQASARTCGRSTADIVIQNVG